MSFTETPELAALHAAVMAGHNVFVCGRAGTGKSTALRALREAMEDSSKRVVSLAPTGIAAQNVSGMTIHRFFRFPIHALSEDDWVASAWNPKNFNNRDLMRMIDVLIIDEISMVRVDLLDAVDKTLRIVRARKDPQNKFRPFGGAQVLLFGDPYQLPPVTKEDPVREYLTQIYGSDLFFCAPACGENFKMVELTHVFRQRDADMREILNAVRDGNVSEAQFARLNQCVRPPVEGAIHLVPTRARAEQINNDELYKLGQEVRTFLAQENRMNERDTPVDAVLNLCVGARVMFCTNDRKGRFFNGMTGTVKEFIEFTPVDDDYDGLDTAPPTELMVRVEVNGQDVDVSPHTWEKYEYTLDRAAGKLGKSIVGSFRQMPLRLAWAITIHKAQGLTVEKLHIDLDGGAFASGQTYVALSRATGWDGFSLARPVYPQDVMVDQNIRWYRERFQNAVIEREAAE